MFMGAFSDFGIQVPNAKESALPGRICGIARKIEIQDLQEIQKKFQKKASETIQKEKEDAAEKCNKK